MKDYRKMLEEIGGYENEMIGVPAGTVREMVSEIERLRAKPSDFAMREVDGFSFYEKAKLLPCPYCHGTELEFNRYLADGWVECSECESQGPHDHLAQVFLEKCEGNSIDLWNDREDK